MLKLKQLRKDAGLSIRALSERSGVPQRTIEDIEAAAIVGSLPLLPFARL